MNHTLPRTLLFAALLATSAVAHAQDQRRGGDGMGPPPACERAPSLDRMAADLNLTAAQQAQLKAIFDEHRQADQSMRDTTRAQMEQLREQTDAKIAKVLNADQLAKFKADRESHRPRRGPEGGERQGPGMRSGGPMGSPPPCPPPGEDGPPPADG